MVITFLEECFRPPSQTVAFGKPRQKPCFHIAGSFKIELKMFEDDFADTFTKKYPLLKNFKSTFHIFNFLIYMPKGKILQSLLLFFVCII